MKEKKIIIILVCVIIIIISSFTFYNINIVNNRILSIAEIKTKYAVSEATFLNINIRNQFSSC